MGTLKLNKAAGGVKLSGLEYYSFRDYKRLLGRRKWLIVSVTLTVACAIAFAASRAPSLYQAKTTIMVDPGKVPESYVKSTATIDANQRLALLHAQILSTARLGQVIDELGLYSGMKKTSSREEVVARMRKDITVTPAMSGGNAKELQAFEIAYSSGNPTLVAQVANRLASLFIEENLKAREQQVLGTADFFQHELEKAKQDLNDKAQKLAALRAQYFSELPESQTWHTQALTSLQMEMRAELDAVSSAEQQKAYAESLLAESPSVVNLDSSSEGSTAGLDDQLVRLQQEMDQLHTRYGPSYPDVVSKAAEIEKIQKQIKEQNKAEKPTSSGPRKRHNPVVESQIAQLDDAIKKHEAREKDLKSQIAYHEGVLARAPAAEQELTAATNDYNDAADHYKRLEDHKFSADMSSDVESRQKGERFVILETAQPPEHPYSPNRLLIDLLGLAGGAVIALALAVGLDILDNTVKTQRELGERLTVPVFAEIPWRTTKVVKKRWRIKAVLAVGGSLILAVAYSGLLAVALR